MSKYKGTCNAETGYEVASIWMKFVWRRLVPGFAIANIFYFKLKPDFTDFVTFVSILQMGK
jgi:hypothetical protein